MKFLHFVLASLATLASAQNVKITNFNTNRMYRPKNPETVQVKVGVEFYQVAQQSGNYFADAGSKSQNFDRVVNDDLSFKNYWRVKDLGGLPESQTYGVNYLRDLQRKFPQGENRVFRSKDYITNSKKIPIYRKMTTQIFARGETLQFLRTDILDYTDDYISPDKLREKAVLYSDTEMIARGGKKNGKSTKTFGIQAFSCNGRDRRNAQYDYCNMD